MNDEHKTLPTVASPAWKVSHDPPGQWGIEARALAAAARAELWEAYEADLASARETVQALKNAPPCGGVLAYETMAGVFRVHKAGVYRFRCPKCGHEGTNDGEARTCDQPAPAAKP